MPNYIASGLGGIGGSGVMPDTRPQINIADAINSISQAYQNNKQGVLTKAYMQAQNQREQQASNLAQANAATNGILPTAQAHDYVGQNNDAFDKANTPPQAPAGNPSLPGVGGLPSPGQVMPMASQTQPTPAMLPAAAPSGPITASSPPPPMQITGGALPAAAPAPPTPQPPSDRLSSFVPGAPHTFGSRRLSMPIDLGNGYSMIPEMTAAGRSYDLMQARMEGMLQGRMITGDYGNQRANITGGYHIAGIGEQQGGANTRTQEEIDSAKALETQRGEMALLLEAARGNVQAINQLKQQQFDKEQQARTQVEQERLEALKHGSKIDEIGATGGNSIITSIGRGLGILKTPPTPQQTDWDNAAQHLHTTKPGVDPSTVLGQRP